ncbi:hypothetical protein WMF26_40185 [Sorangium sp. So ce185]|uniref:hypothetical protein n=1 Tax=Sorangium sp. So ce185 TaxID=3133287 RepID=UPI003F60DDC6
MALSWIHCGNGPRAPDPRVNPLRPAARARTDLRPDRAPPRRARPQPFHLKLALRDLLDERVEELRLSATGRLYEPRLRARQKEIEAIPEAAGTQAPLARELSEADVRHDGIGAAILFLCKVIEAHPSLAPEVKAAAAGAQQAFVPRLEVLRAPCADEASAAFDNQPELTRLKAESRPWPRPVGAA